jgi:5-methylcytosine-specific restriction protein A
MYLRRYPLCVECQRNGRTVEAIDVHHLVPRRAGGSDADDNLQALCHACHSRVTAGGG